MTNLRTLPVPAQAAPSHAPHRHRLRAVAPDEVPPVAELLHPGATWMPAPQHTLPSLPGQPPMIGYLVLVPAEQPSPEAAGPATEGDALVRIDPEQRTASVAGRVLDLTYLEFELLAHLVAHPHRVHTRDQLVTTVWGYGHVGDGRTVDVHVARLRRKMGAEHRSSIVTVRRVGYKYAPPAGL
ncbi:winged helix-turn-helix domain-containing protein [Streptomyces griseocarneus]|uniref:winged helix-turn-helix domain-containing protein n=1 Tax=Streptomyces griseocarneus TaxID=51201 RepID=UPI00167CE488|nr:winged helix-turn-helix domain-containing protein [Streptomyces griseocarneus]MBZ6472086.1 winged helix-turn-helix domain-containing protein [Streptomyces griseocarneus]GHG73909.1 transcriptional regulator [Streptomyces griseocarneus]